MDYSFKFAAIWRYRDEIYEGVFLTLQLSVATMVLGLIIGLAFAVMRNAQAAWLRGIARGYVEAIRNTPLLVQLFIVFYGLPSIGIRLAANEAALIALSVNLGAYCAEIIRAGIESVRVSQVEAGRSLGMTASQTFVHVVLFQAMKAIYPAMASQFILLMLATSIVSSIGATELFHQAAFIESRTYRSFEAYALITIVYLGLTLVFRALFSAIYWTVFIRRPAR
ncbi:amino acid ABC transporter permease [Microbaculum marinisediminis]|uniref:Amino acid ABC transporter permease n=1 Tax=Microbaculum marinisediminis TaxID=2931392 RepID=A0AAW5QS39_9HYPH|nr:amino acid ABC transporter permease [Microbaculum sp. A6E488]MCT8970911.1 amino acid ABC transporter permease [Microbaculum sp. A6E488]